MRIRPTMAIFAAWLFWAGAAAGIGLQDPAGGDPGLALIEAAARGDAARVESLIASGADLESRDAEGTTALMAASRRGHFRVVQLLVDAGADRMATDPAGRTARYWAAGWNEVIRILEAGTGFAGPGEDGIVAPRLLQQFSPRYTPEARAARQQGTVVLDAVIRSDGAVAIMDVQKGLGFGLDQSAIDALSQWRFAPGTRDGQPIDVRLSVEVNFSLSGLETPPSVAADPVPQPNADPGPPLVQAASEGDVARVEALIASGADLEVRDAEGTTALMAASQRGHAAVVGALLDAGADRMATDSKGRSARYWAAGWAEVIRILETGAGYLDVGESRVLLPRVLTRVEARYTDEARSVRQQGAVVLDAVVRSDGTVAIMDLRQSLGYGLDESAVEALSQWTFEPGTVDGEPVDVSLTIWVNFNLRGEGVQDRVFAAAAQGDRDRVEDGLEAGGEVDARDGAGRTPLYLAAENGHERIVRTLLEAGADPEVPARNGTTPLIAAALRGDEDVTRELVAGGAAVDRANDDGVTPLIAASLEGKEDVVEILLAAGARTELRTRDGSTALVLASIQGEQDVVEFLLEGGADPDLATPAGVTPLMVAAENGHEDIVERLLDAGADVLRVADNGATALRVAIGQDHDDIVRLLREAGAER